MEERRKYEENINKKVKIILKNSFNYNGFIINEDEFLLIIKDKFGNIVHLAKSEICLMEEVGK